MSRKKLTIACIVLCLAGFLFPQTLFDDLLNNNTEDFDTKLALLNVKIQEFPYIAYYVAFAKKLQTSTIDYLLKKGANVNQTDKDYLPALFYAVMRNNLPIVQTLIKAKADVNALVEFDGRYREASTRFSLNDFWEIEAIKHISQTKSSPLDFAFSFSSPAIVKELLNAKADPLLVLHQEIDTAQSTAKNTVYANYTVIDAAFSYIAGCIRDKLTPYWPFFSKAHLLWQAVMKLPEAKRPQMPYADNIYTYLIAGNTELFKKTLAGLTGDTIQYIPYALIVRQWDLVELLLKLNSLGLDDPIKLGTYKEQSLLAWAITAGFPEEAILLLSKGAKIPEFVYYKTGDQYPVLVEAAYGGDIALVEALIKKGASVADNQALLDVHNKPEIRKLLIKAGMDPNKKFTYYEYTFYSVLTDAALFGYEEAVSYYLSIKVPYNASDPAEVPPLFAAVVSANPKIVDMLIKAGADINQYVDCYSFEDFFFVYLNGSYTPLALAYFMRDNTDDQYKKSQYTKIIKMLEKLGAVNKTSVQ